MKAFRYLVIFFSMLAGGDLFAQPSCYFEHYSTEDGLPQYTIMDMLQDKKGFMWFATWDGLSKFDGNTFRNFKVQPEDTYYMRSNRIQKLYEDKYGNIWLKSYDDEAHCFNTQQERFTGIKAIAEYQNYSFKLTEIQPKPSGKVWLLSEGNGCFCVTDSLFSVQLFNQEKGRIKGNTVFNVFEDSRKRSWILTDNGLSLWKDADSDEIVLSYFFENVTGNGNQAFYTAIEFENEIWFGSDKGRIWKYVKNTGKFELLEIQTYSNISGFQNISNDELIITTQNDGFFIYNRTDFSFSHYNTLKNPVLKSNQVKIVFFDSLGQCWFEAEDLGIYKLNVQTGKLTYFYVKTEDVAIALLPPYPTVFEDVNGRIWVHPKGGGFSLYNKEKDQLEPFYNVESSSDWKFSNILHSAYSDRQGNLWFCTRSHGLEKVIFDSDFFKTIQINANAYSSIANDVRAVFQDDDKKIWVSTKDGRLTVYDEDYSVLGYFSSDGSISSNGNYLSGAVYCMAQDKKGVIWIGTKGNGVFKLHKTAETNRYRVEHFKWDENNIYSLSDNIVYSIFEDTKGNIWIGTYGNGLNLVRENELGQTIFINHRNNLKGYPIDIGYRIRFISENKWGNICIGTTMGLFMFSGSFTMPDEIEFHHYSRTAGVPESLSNNDVHAICNTENGDMYLATFGGGLNRVEAFDDRGFPLKFKVYTVTYGLPSDVCLAILEDEYGKLWISMENNLSRFDPEKEVFETFTEIKRLMSEYSFSEASACRLSNNNLVFGFSSGLLTFAPGSVSNSDFKPYIALSNFRLFNRQVPIGKEKSPLKKSIDDIDELILTKKQNFFSIEYAALDLTAPDDILYAYKLEGFDNDWNYAQKQRIANYTNIPKGHYVFRIKSTNSEGLWVDNERSLPITILPSFWETPFAYVLYVLLFIGLVSLCVYILFVIYRLKNNVEVEKQMAEMKLRFFTDISHEIRTPLTMITAPVDHLIADKKTPENIKNQLSLISKNTNRLLHLVNQIMDFRKVQHFRLMVKETDLGEFTQLVCQNFYKLAESQHIDFSFQNQVPGVKIWVDQDCLEKIIMNLVSNAFKFTSGGKSIRIVVNEDDKHVWLKVEDEGAGISKEKQKRLFTRFASYNEDKSKPSTGIGLNIVKDLVDKHAAKIIVESNLGKGSCFAVGFQKGISHYSKDVEIIASVAAENSAKNENTENPVEVVSEDNEIKNRKATVLIVEDDVDLKGFIRTILEEDYTIIEAGDGIEGAEKAEKVNPDFIVSDIMMPRMDGIGLLKRLKENINTSHIPVVLLTAKTTIESKLEGLSYGADDYITKPFSVPYFRARITNLLEQRKRLQEIYRNHLTSSSSVIEYEPQPYIVTSQDEILMQRVIEIIEKNLDNGEFSVEDLSSLTGMSRSVFYHKVKSLTGLSPIEFIRDIKMKKAAQFLSSGELMVKEVAYMIGISDTKYFGRCFKAKYGMTPQEYKNKESKSSI